MSTTHYHVYCCLLKFFKLVGQIYNKDQIKYLYAYRTLNIDLWNLNVALCSCERTVRQQIYIISKDSTLLWNRLPTCNFQRKLIWIMHTVVVWVTLHKLRKRINIIFQNRIDIHFQLNILRLNGALAKVLKYKNYMTNIWTRIALNCYENFKFNEYGKY